MNKPNEEVKRGRPSKPPEPPSDAVRATREALGMTQEDVAREIKCSLSAVRRFERERALPSNSAIKENFQKLAARAGIEIDS
jgi:ribosome-binding protein aMBF1 (putative translation factor)